MLEARDRVGGRTYTVEEDGTLPSFETCNMSKADQDRYSVRDGRNMGYAPYGESVQGDGALQDGS